MSLRALRPLALLLALACASCAAPQGPASRCGSVGEAYCRTELFFGMSIQGDEAGAQVTEAQWAAFLAEVVTPRFPDGLTVIRSQGQWMGPSGPVQEEGRLLVLLSPRSSCGAKEKPIEEIRALYTKRFRQDSVMRVTSEARVSF